MIPFSLKPTRIQEWQGKEIACFDAEYKDDKQVVHSFSAEWKKFNRFTEKEIEAAGDQYFDIINSEMLNSSSQVLDIGCGSGRWTRYVSKKAAFVEGIDLIDSIHTAVAMNADKKNVRISRAGVGNIPFADESFDFIMCLGVLHHLSNTEESLKTAVKKLKPGGHFLLYVYYKLDEAGPIMNILFALSTVIRVIVSRLPNFLKLPICDLIAFFIYYPFVLLTKMVHFMSPNKKWYRQIPLYYYADKSFRIMRNDSLDRFGTTIEKRFSRNEVNAMMQNAGLSEIILSENAPCWHAVGKKLK